MIPGYKIIEHYVGKDVGDVDAWQGVFSMGTHCWLDWRIFVAV